jgi:hypothetical protein
MYRTCPLLVAASCGTGDCTILSVGVLSTTLIRKDSRYSHNALIFMCVSVRDRIFKDKICASEHVSSSREFLNFWMKRADPSHKG